MRLQGSRPCRKEDVPLLVNLLVWMCMRRKVVVTIGLLKVQRIHDTNYTASLLLLPKISSHVALHNVLILTGSCTQVGGEIARSRHQERTTTSIKTTLHHLLRRRLPDPPCRTHVNTLSALARRHVMLLFAHAAQSVLRVRISLLVVVGRRLVVLVLPFAFGLVWRGEREVGVRLGRRGTRVVGGGLDGGFGD